MQYASARDGKGSLMFGGLIILVNADIRKLATVPAMRRRTL